MGWGTGNIGGGSGGLNFKVICNPQPSTAKENTIWVDTDRINNYYFSATQPENMVDYDVWFPVGTSSPVEFNALKKGGIQVYPLSAKQMISGALVDKTSMSYQGGQWVEWWNGDLFVNGDQVTLITGGWKAVYNTGSKATIGDVITFTVTGSNYRDAAVFTEKKVNLSGYSKIDFHVNITSAKGPVRVGVTTENTSYLPTFVASAETTATGSRVLTAILGNAPKECYVSVYADQAALTVSEIRALR